MEQTQITDLYQASYLLLSGCELIGIECIPTGGSISCSLRFQGKNVNALNDAWWRKDATVNLWNFRTAYSQINSFVHQAKKSYDQTRRTGGAS